VKSLTATEAARKFADLLDAVERDGESFVIVRRGRPVARIEPATAGSGRAVKALLRSGNVDDGWLDDLRVTREAVSVEDRRWRG
jgi:prevent-host-death family protein